MHITFHGAAREVTGSMHLITTESDNILLDCGMFQGRRREAAEKNRVFSVDPGILTNVVLSHAHIDHSGRIPLLPKNGFSGRIVCTRPTVDACDYLLRDSAHIQESDADYLNYKSIRSTLSEMQKTKKAKKISGQKLREIKSVLKKSRHDLNVETIQELMKKHRLEKVQPLYTMKDAEQSLDCFSGYPYRQAVEVGRGATCTLYEAGHILGSAISILKIREKDRVCKIGFTGDLGRFNNPILEDPELNFAEEDRDLDLLIMESTYGDRTHEPMEDLKNRLRTVLNEALDRKGVVVIPSFAFGRTQTLIYTLHELYNENAVTKVPVYVDSPLATNLTKVFGEHPEVYDRETHKTFLEKGQNPFMFPQMNFIGSVEESMALNRENKSHIVISASGMCEAGRVLHHLRYRIHDPKNTILLVGFMAQHTLGRRIEEQGLDYEASGRQGKPPLMKILNKEYPMNAHVVKIGGFSAHADKTEMLHFLKKSNLKIKKIAVVHGEETQSISFSETLRSNGYDIAIPRQGESFSI
jgi:metallo-beta-lactamase family protein